MDKASVVTPESFPFPSPAWFRTHGKAYLNPYYLTIVGMLGAATVGFLVVIGLLIMVAANFNILSLIE